MYRELLDNISDDSLGELLSKLSHEGFIKRAGEARDLDEDGLRDAWDTYWDDGAEAAVNYLESYFGFVFDEE